MSTNAKPIIHLNGSGRTFLLNAYSDAAKAVDEAMEVLRATYPHGRDYYPNGDATLDEAKDEHKARHAQLYAVREELRVLAEHCADT